MRLVDEVTVVIGINEITKLLYEVDEISRLTRLVQRLEALYPQQRDPKLVADTFRVDQRIFGLIVYGHSVTDWQVEMLFGPLSHEREIHQTIDDVSESLGLPPPIIGD
jgi:hypothetical protein